MNKSSTRLSTIEEVFGSDQKDHKYSESLEEELRTGHMQNIRASNQL